MEKVLFTLVEQSVVRSPTLRTVVRDVFGIDLNAYRDGDIWISCRPDQFAKFIIVRNDRGVENLVKQLQPRIISTDRIYKQCDCGVTDKCLNKKVKPNRGHCVIPIQRGAILPRKNYYDVSGNA